MLLKNLLIGSIAFTLTSTLAVGTAHAQTFTGNSTTDPTSWSDSTNWSGGVPTSTGYAIIGSSFTVNFDVASSATIGRFSIAGTFNIPAGKLLIVDGTAPNAGGTDGINLLNGTIALQGENSILRFIDINQTLSGGGSIQGEHNAARLQIGDGLTLVNYIHIEGALMIEADDEENEATLSNTSASAAVIANESEGTLAFRPSLILSDDDTGGSPTYAAVADGATMEFTRQHNFPGLLGNFVLSDCGATFAFMPIVYDQQPDFIFTAGTFTDGANGAPYGYLLFRDGANFAWDSGSEDTDGYVGNCL